MRNFKQCPSCGRQWLSQEEFLADPDIVLIGLQVCFESLLKGLILFTHSCETTFPVEVGRFENLYDGPIYNERVTGSADCLGYCLNEKEFKPCTAKCDCAFVREILQVIRNFPKIKKD